MTQVKVISETNPQEFERKMNESLKAGWKFSNISINNVPGCGLAPFTAILVTETPEAAIDFSNRQ